MVKEGSEPCGIRGVVEGVEAKVARTLPLLWNKWKYTGIAEILYSHFKACIQMDKQAKSEKEFHLCPIL